VVTASVERGPSWGIWRRDIRPKAREGPGKYAAHILPVIAPTCGFCLIAKHSLVYPHVVVVAQVRLNNVVQFYAGRRPIDVRRFRLRRLSRHVKSPAKDRPHVVPVIVAAGGLSFITEYALVNRDVAVVAQMRLDDVVQIEARRRPLRQNGRP